MAKPLAATSASEAPIQDFSDWMREEQRRVFRLCYNMLQDADEADAATQDTFYKAWQALDRIEAEDLSDSRRWVTRIAVNTCLDRLRSRKWQFWRRRPSSESEELILRMAPSDAPSAEDRVFARQIARRLNEGLAKLSGRQRSIFLLRHQEGMTLEEIGQTLGLETGTVKAHMARALAKMRTELQDIYTSRGAPVLATGDVITGGSR